MGETVASSDSCVRQSPHTLTTTLTSQMLAGAVESACQCVSRQQAPCPWAATQASSPPSLEATTHKATPHRRSAFARKFPLITPDHRQVKPDKNFQLPMCTDLRVCVSSAHASWWLRAICGLLCWLQLRIHAALSCPQHFCTSGWHLSCMLAFLSTHTKVAGMLVHSHAQRARTCILSVRLQCGPCVLLAIVRIRACVRSS
jgi:hypothetical protein